MYPIVRLRRNRNSFWLRELVAENHLSVSDLILPIFVTEGKEVKEPISTLPGVSRLSIDNTVRLALEAEELGIKAIALFPHIDEKLKSLMAEEAYNPDNLIARCVKSLRSEGLKIGIICDVALDPYTTHGQDGIMVGDQIDNDGTVQILQRQALSLAQAGVDIVAPSDMMDGRIGAIREILDQNNFSQIPILAYAAKYASAFYGPFRDAVGSKKALGNLDKKTYQLDPRNSMEALREIELDIAEGADIILVKPGMPYLDIIYAARQNTDIPIFAYQVSGEYAMMKLGALNGSLEWEKVIIESFYCFKRAGAQGIFTYAAIDVAKILNGLSI